MVKFDVKPCLTIRPNNDVSGTVKLTTSKWGNEFSATVSDEMVKDNKLSANGLRLGLKAQSMELEYGVSDHTPKLIFRSGVTIKDKDIALKYTHQVRTGAELEATVKVDDNSTATLTYDLSNYDGPDHKNLRVKWAYTHNDFLIEPALNLGTESFSAAVTYKVDDENKLKASYDTKSNVGHLEWTNSSNLGGGGDLKLTARSVMDGDSIKKMPTLMLEKTWDFDV